MCHRSCTIVEITPVRDSMYDSCLVRQPFFDRNNALMGYEIRFRDTDEGRAALVQSLLSGTFDIIRGGLPAFVACSRAQLLDSTFDAAEAMGTVLMMPPALGPDNAVMEALHAFRKKGGMIALDGLDETPAPSEALAQFVSWVRMDLRDDDIRSVARVCDRVAQGKPKFMADHILEETQYRMAVQLGFDAFQGPYFSRVETIAAADLPASTVAAMRLLGLARDPNVPDRALEDAVSTDPVLTFQLLRLVNSAAVGVRAVSSIGHALRVIGRTAFLRWLALAIAASRGAKSGVDQHLVRQAVERGRLLEQLAGQGRDAGTLFLVGLFSLMDAVFRMPLHDIVSRVALGEDAKAALLDRSGPYAKPLAFAESYELGMFESAMQVATELGVMPDKLPELYTSAISWTNEALGAVTAKPPERKLAAR
jgi:EAL and modified HD-GYP domain-containing signal transduction protein